MSLNKVQSWLDSYFKSGVKSLLVGGTPVAIPPGAPPAILANFASGVSGAYNPATGFVDLTVTAAVVAGQNPASLSNGLNSNIATGGQPTVRLAGPSAAFSVGGFQLPGAATPQAGQQLAIINTSSQPMTIVHEDASSAAAARIDTQSGLPVTLLPRPFAASLVYNGNTNRWVLQPAVPHISNTIFTGNTLSWDTNPIFTGMAAFVTGLSVPCVAGAVMHVGRPATWPAGVHLAAFATAANTVSLEAINCSGTTQTLPTAITDLFSVSVHQ